MPLGSEKVVNVIGHINPDTDSICSAIAYARLKREVTGENYVAKRAGQINAETRFFIKKSVGTYEGRCTSDTSDSR